MRIYKNFQSAYVSVVRDLYKNGQYSVVRDNEMQEMFNYMFKIENPADRVLNLKSRRNIYRYSFGELLWYLSGHDDIEFINKYSKQWAPLSDDGLHANSAYGKYIFGLMHCKGEGIRYTLEDELASGIESQWNWVQKVLRNDPYSRQAVIQIKPIQMYNTKDVTCTYALQFFVRDGKLDMTAIMRSNDVLFGLTYDVFMFTTLQELMAAELGYELGTYTHFAANMHFYYKDIEKITEIIHENASAKTYQLAMIPGDFRKIDLPLLQKFEQEWWNDTHDYHKLYDLRQKMSPYGQDLTMFLTTEIANYNK